MTKYCCLVSLYDANYKLPIKKKKKVQAGRSWWEATITDSRFINRENGNKWRGEEVYLNKSKRLDRKK